MSGKKDKSWNSNNDNIEGGWMIGFMFRTPMMSITTDVLISTITRSEFVHVDMLFYRKGCKNDVSRRELFSTFIGENFRGYVTKSWKHRDNKSHTLLALEVTEQVYNFARKYISDLCTKEVRYNYTDLCGCLIPKTIISMGFLVDVDPYPIPKSVYCSQAAVLMLRYALSGDWQSSVEEEDEALFRMKSVRSAIHRINSRSCSPHMLFTILKDCNCEKLDVVSFVNDVNDD